MGFLLPSVAVQQAYSGKGLAASHTLRTKRAKLMGGGPAATDSRAGLGTAATVPG
jgi:hypothetical protein